MSLKLPLPTDDQIVKKLEDPNFPTLKIPNITEELIEIYKIGLTEAPIAQLQPLSITHSVQSIRFLNEHINKLQVLLKDHQAFSLILLTVSVGIIATAVFAAIVINPFFALLGLLVVIPTIISYCEQKDFERTELDTFEEFLELSNHPTPNIGGAIPLYGPSQYIYKAFTEMGKLHRELKEKREALVKLIQNSNYSILYNETTQLKKIINNFKKIDFQRLPPHPNNEQLKRIFIQGNAIAQLDNLSDLIEEAKKCPPK